MSLFEWLSCSRATQTPWQISLRSCRRRDTRRRVTMDAPGEIRPPFFVCINRVEKDTKTLLVILLPTRDVILHPIEKRESKERKKSLLQSAFVVVVHYVVVPNRNARRVNIIFQGRTRRASLRTTKRKTRRRRRKIRASVNARYVCVVKRFGF